MERNLFGDPFEDGVKRPTTESEKQKRKWENAFQKWSNKTGFEGTTHYGSCGFGAICDYCKDNSYGRPCVRALNALLRDKGKVVDYCLNDAAFESAFDGEEYKDEVSE